MTFITSPKNGRLYPDKVLSIKRLDEIQSAITGRNEAGDLVGRDELMADWGIEIWQHWFEIRDLILFGAYLRERVDVFKEMKHDQLCKGGESACTCGQTALDNAINNYDAHDCLDWK